jgi:ankyrin repeat protein
MWDLPESQLPRRPFHRTWPYNMGTVADSLIWAAKRSDIDAMRKAIHSGADLNGVDIGGWTPLFHAAHQGHTEGVKLLIQAGADVNHGKETGFTALFSAVLGGHVEAVRALLDAGAEIVPMQGTDLRGFAIRENSKRHDAILKMLDGRKGN